jgi:hypothetical protein
VSVTAAAALREATRNRFFVNEHGEQDKRKHRRCGRGRGERKEDRLKKKRAKAKDEMLLQSLPAKKKEKKRAAQSSLSHVS